MCLLSKCHASSPSLTPLPYICQLLLARGVQASVTTTIMHLLENLLTVNEGEGEVEEGGPAPVDPGTSWIVDYHQGKTGFLVTKG